MLQILIWSTGIILVGLGFMFFYMTKAFPVKEIKTKYRCESCNRIHKEYLDKCECGGYFRAVKEAQVADPQPVIFKFISIVMMDAGPILIWIANRQAASIDDLMRGLY